MDHHKFLYSAIILPLGFLLIFLNLLILDFQFFRNTNPMVIQSVTQTVTPVPTHPTNLNVNCDASCLSRIEAAVKTDLSQQQIEPTSALSQKVNNAEGAKEFYIQLGGGLSAASDWQNVPGLQTYIESSSYPNIKFVTFEASVHLPTTNELVYVRLYDVTDQHPVWLSDVTYNGDGNPKLLISQPISLDSGNKLYQVQMKTQLQAPASLDQSSVHITLN